MRAPHETSDSAPQGLSGHDADGADQVARASAIASIAHRGQVDKLGDPYIGHPQRVAALVHDDPIAASVAWLHDVVEDCGISADDLRNAGVASAVVDAVVLLTRTDDVDDVEYYARIRSHPLARKVKAADIADNTAPWRTERLPASDRERLTAKYEKARRALGL